MLTQTSITVIETPKKPFNLDQSVNAHFQYKRVTFIIIRRLPVSTSFQEHRVRILYLIIANVNGTYNLILTLVSS